MFRQSYKNRDSVSAWNDITKQHLLAIFHKAAPAKILNSQPITNGQLLLAYNLKAARRRLVGINLSDSGEKLD